MKRSLKVGVSFGLTSGIITTLGLIVGLNSGTHSRLAVLGGILTIAIADACSDALGIHVSEESEGKHSTKEIWESTFSTLASKFVFALTFAAPVLIFELSTAIIVGVAWGFLLLGILSFYMSKPKQRWKAVLEHYAIAAVVIVITHLVGVGVSKVLA